MKKKNWVITMNGDEDILSLIKEEIWSLVKSFRYNGYEFQNLKVELFLLILQNEGAFEKINFLKVIDIKEEIASGIKVLNSKNNSKKLIGLYDIYYFEALASMADESIISFLKELQTFCNLFIDPDGSDFVRENFPEIFDFLLLKMAQKNSCVGHIVPIQLEYFISELSNAQEISRVYNPFADVASFGLFLEYNPIFYAQELNKFTSITGTLRLLAYGNHNKIYFNHDSAIKNWEYDEYKDTDTSERFKFDLIVSKPPFGRLPNGIKGRFGTIKSYEHYLIERGIESIKANGRIIAILTVGFLFRGGAEKKLRELLIEQDMVEMIIALPGGSLLQTNISTVIFVLNKNKTNKGKVRFIEASSAFKILKGNRKILDRYVMREIISDENNNSISRFVPNSTIIENGFNLSVSRYFISEIKIGGDESLINLGEFIKPLIGVRSVVGEYGTLVRNQDMQEDSINFQLSSEIPEDVKIPIGSKKVEESCLLLATRGGKIKPTWFGYLNSPIFISNDIFAFKVDLSKIDIAFLINELADDYVTDQFKSYQTGNIIPVLALEDLSKIKIKVPGCHIKKKFSNSLKEQKAKVKGVRQEMIRNIERSLALEKEILEIKDDAFRDLAAMKHTFRQYLNALKTNVSGTRKFIIKNSGQSITMDSIYSQNLNRSLGEHLSSLEGTIDSMSNILSTLDEGISDGEKMETNLIDLIKKGQDMFKNPEVFKFKELYLDKEAFVQGPGYLAPMVWINPDDFYRLFSNIVSNAIEHGFKGRTNNVIATSLTYDPENLFCILEVANNGIPINEKFTLKHLTTRGEKTSDSSGSGVGGSDIKNIVDKYDGSFNIEINKSDEFAVKYVIGLPLVIYSF